MSDAFATVDELQSRLDFTMTEAERGVALGALEDLTTDARTYGRPSWTPLTAPAVAKSLVLRAAARYMRNPDGYDTSRAGDETLTWQKVSRQADTAEFTREEVARLRALRGVTGFGTLSVYAWGNQSGARHDGDLRIPPHGDPFIAADEVEWVGGAFG